jgi:hypothetical protein
MMDVDRSCRYWIGSKCTYAVIHGRRRATCVSLSKLKDLRFPLPLIEGFAPAADDNPDLEFRLQYEESEFE